MFRITEGKSKNARRALPILPEFHGMLRDRWEAQGRPSEGWVFPAASKSGHVSDSIKRQHSRALRLSNVRRFVPYDLRHTALTRLAPLCDGFTLTKISGHSSIAMAQRLLSSTGRNRVAGVP